MIQLPNDKKDLLSDDKEGNSDPNIYPVKCEKLYFSILPNKAFYCLNGNIFHYFY